MARLMRHLFERLLAAGTESQVQAILDAEGLASDNSKWTPYVNNESFYGVAENQQAHPISALVEKITNGIDAILEEPRSEFVSGPMRRGVAADGFARRCQAKGIY